MHESIATTLSRTIDTASGLLCNVKAWKDLIRHISTCENNTIDSRILARHVAIFEQHGFPTEEVKLIISNVILPCAEPNAATLVTNTWASFLETAIASSTFYVEKLPESFLLDDNATPPFLPGSTSDDTLMMAIASHTIDEMKYGEFIEISQLAGRSDMVLSAGIVRGIDELRIVVAKMALNILEKPTCLKKVATGPNKDKVVEEFHPNPKNKEAHECIEQEGRRGAVVVEDRDQRREGRDCRQLLDGGQQPDQRCRGAGAQPERADQVGVAGGI